MKLSEYKSKLGWNTERDPFTLSIVLDTLVKEKDLYEAFLNSIDAWDRVIILTGPIGGGKTTMVEYLKNHPPRDTIVIDFNSKRSVEDTVKRIVSAINKKGSWIYRLLGIKQDHVDKDDLGYFITKEAGHLKTLIIWDEAQDCSEETFTLLRELTDKADNLFIIFIGLPILERVLSEVTSFRDRAVKTLKTSPFTEEVLKTLIMERIRWVGGKDIKPFTDEAIGLLVKDSRGNPRSLLKKCHEVIKKAAEDEIFEINAEFAERHSILSEEPTVIPREEPANNLTLGPDFVKELSPMQQDIVEVLQKKHALTASQIAKEIGKDYASTEVNLRRLMTENQKEMKEGVPYPVIRKRPGEEGKSQYIYALSEQARRLLAMK